MDARFTKQRINYFNKYAGKNYLVKNGIMDEESFRKKFQDYRNAWNGQPEEIINDFSKNSYENNYCT